MKKYLFIMALMLAFCVPWAHGQTTPYFSEDFESMTVNTVPTGWDNSASTPAEISTNPEWIWGVYAYEGNQMMRMHNYLVHSGTALINTPVIELPSSAPSFLDF